jgi:hypothetical protein
VPWGRVGDVGVRRRGAPHRDEPSPITSHRGHDLVARETVEPLRHIVKAHESEQPIERLVL